MRSVKRSLVIFGTALSLGFVPVASQAVTTSPTPTPSITTRETPEPTPGTAATAAKKVAREAARAEYRSAMLQAQNGRDLAFADANATMMQSLSAAGKDKAARKAAHDTYKLAATGIVAAYKQAIANAMQDYKTAMASATGK
jgi:hypothetical protein